MMTIKNCYNVKRDHTNRCYCGNKATYHVFYGSGCGNVCAKHKKKIARMKNIPKSAITKLDQYIRNVYVRQADRELLSKVEEFANVGEFFSWCLREHSQEWIDEKKKELRKKLAQ